MEKLTDYRALIQKILQDYKDLVSQTLSSCAEVESLLAFDEERGQYFWFQVGWQESRRIQGITVRVRIKDAKFWIEEDWTEEGIASKLLEAGVPNTDIVLGFQAPNMRKHTKFAVA